MNRALIVGEERNSDQLRLLRRNVVCSENGCVNIHRFDSNHLNNFASSYQELIRQYSVNDVYLNIIH